MNITAGACVGGGVRNVLSAQGPMKVNEALRSGKVMFTMCGQPGYILPGGGITIESSIAGMPENSFAWVATPATVMPVEMTTTMENYKAMGGYVDAVRPMDEIRAESNTRTVRLKG